MRKYFESPVIVFMALFLIWAIFQLKFLSNPYKLDHSKWVQYSHEYGCYQEPIWGDKDHPDDILGWRLIQEKTVRHLMFVRVGNDLPPNNVWVVAQGYLVLTVPVDTKGMSSKEKEANRNKKKIFFKFVDCPNGGSTIISSDECVFDGGISEQISAGSPF